jgi:sorbitol-specific phosphotransferase system component IIC
MTGITPYLVVLLVATMATFCVGMRGLTQVNRARRSCHAALIALAYADRWRQSQIARYLLVTQWRCPVSWHST